MALINDPVSAGIDFAKTIVEKIWPDKTEEEKAKLAQEFSIIQGQIAVNQVEAANPSIFVSGWRPAAGWISVIGLGYTYIGQPLLSWASTAFGIPIPPPMDLMPLLSLLFGMLGLGTIRMNEKVRGVART